MKSEENPDMEQQEETQKEFCDDPRILNPEDKGKAQKKRGAGRNTESFDPKSTLVRPEMRIIVGAN